jgi:hypothetical protein
MTDTNALKSMIHRSGRLSAGLALTSLLLLGMLAEPSAALARGGGGRGGRGGGGHSEGPRGGRGGGGYGGWGGGIIVGSPYYCAPPLIYAPYLPYGSCQ